MLFILICITILVLFLYSKSIKTPSPINFSLHSKEYRIELKPIGILGRGFGIEKGPDGANLLKVKKVGQNFIIERVCTQREMFLSQGFPEVLWPRMKGISLGYYRLVESGEKRRLYFKALKYTLIDNTNTRKEALPEVEAKIL